MTTSFITAAVLAGLAFAGLDFARKKLTGSIPSAIILIWITASSCTFFGAWLLISPRAWPESGYVPNALVSISLNIIANILFLSALRVSPLSRTIPFLSLSPAFAAMSAFLVVGEEMMPIQWLGITCVVCGALVLNLAPGEGSIIATMFQSLKNERGSVLMIATAICWGIAAPFDKIAISRASVPAHAFVLGLGVGVVLFAYVLIRGQHRSILKVKHCWKPLVAAMIFAIAALGIQLVAYREGFVGLAETIKRVIGMLSSLVLGYFLFSEKIVPAQIGGVILMSIGVALIL